LIQARAGIRITAGGEDEDGIVHVAVKSESRTRPAL
jgi:hypothetical protein